MILADPALVFVVRFACHRVLRALIPLAAARYVNLVPEHSLEHELIIDRILDRIVLVDLAELCVSFYLLVYAADDVARGTSSSQQILDNSRDASKSLDVLVWAALDALVQVLHILLTETRISRQVQGKNSSRTA